MRLYSDLAEWWPLLSPPSHYPEEAAHLLDRLPPPRDPKPTLLELGSGGGSLAFHLKTRFELTLTDLSAEMLAVSARVNPGIEHRQGDMRTIDLGREFDAVVIHDAVAYMVDLGSLRAALGTAARHCKPGGTVAVLPDCIRETFTESTEAGGEDTSDGRGLRYLEWCWDPDPTDHSYRVAYSLILREVDGTVRHELDVQQQGVFSLDEWLASFEAVGLSARWEVDPWARTIFIATRPR
ncbi:MAG: class I SAM-dependent methyltransferase [Gemmatimonadales bacterium]